MDYRELLKKYMDHVAEEEGITFLGDYIFAWIASTIHEGRDSTRCTRFRLRLPKGGQNMTARLALRPYQHEALDALHAGWDESLLRLAVVLPTGLGKTVIFAELCRDEVAQGNRPLILVHREELAQQAADKLRSVDPSLRVGIVKAERREYDADVLVCSVPTIARLLRMAELIRHLPPVPRRLIVVDECHHAAAPTWVRALQDLGAFDGARTAGFTATLTREDGRHLGDVWQKVVYSRDILFGIRHNPPYLTDVKGKRVTVDEFDLASVAKSRGDYQEGALRRSVCLRPVPARSSLSHTSSTRKTGPVCCSPRLCKRRSYSLKT